MGSLGDFAELLDQADELGMRIILDLVVNHTSDQHPWFQSALRGPGSPHHDWYVWSREEPADRWTGGVFPGVEHETWTFSEQAGLWYRHRFYRFQPDLNTEHPLVRAEIRKIMAFWLRLGVAGFRIDGAPFLLERRTGNGSGDLYDYQFLCELRETASWRRADAVLLAEANVADHELLEYFGSTEASRATMVFAFRLNQAVMLALARQDAGPIRDTLIELPELPRQAQWATFLRNHDEVDLGRLTPAEREEVFAAFGPDPDMQIYHRGLRRRLAPMLGNDRRRLELAYSLLLSLPGTPVLRYGDEIGMGENLALPERESIRTPMQWADLPHAGFSTAEHTDLVAPVITGGAHGYATVNVTDERLDPHSLLTWFERMLHTRRECGEIGCGDHTVLDSGNPAVLAHLAAGERGAILFLHNLSPHPCRVAPAGVPAGERPPLNLAADGDYDKDVDLDSLALNGYGYRWLRLPA